MVNNYNKLKKKYGLPDLKKLKESLELEVKVDQNLDALVQTLRNDISDKLYDTMKVLESILFTNEGSDAGLLYQENMIKDVSKIGFELYKTLNVLHYEGLKLRFTHNRKQDSGFINKVFNLWPDLEKKLLVFFEAIEKGWEELDINRELKPENYHG